MITKYTYWFWEEAIDPEFCAFILARIDWEKNKHVGTVFSENKINTDENIRKTNIFWEKNRSVIGIVMDAYVKEANIAAEWNFDITHADEIQLAQYTGDGGHYAWHADSEPPVNNRQRKLSAVILLNNSSEFEGGQFEFESSPSFTGLHKAGSIVVFPSYLRHRVTPVTKGTRYTATCWVNGPAFR